MPLDKTIVSRKTRRNAGSPVAVVVVALALELVVSPPTTFAGMDETMKAFQQSEFSFARSVSEVPFYPIGWAQDNFYPRAEFKDERGVLPMGAVVEPDGTTFVLTIPKIIRSYPKVSSLS